jgi:hypothetical protein
VKTIIHRTWISFDSSRKTVLLALVLFQNRFFHPGANCAIRKEGICLVIVILREAKHGCVGNDEFHIIYW